MGTTTKQIAAHIEDTRDALGSNLQELEQKVKAAADWRHHVRAKPATLLGLAFGGGIVLATVFGSRSSPDSGRRLSNCSTGARPITTSTHHQESSGNPWNKVKAAVIAAAAARLISYTAELFHGPREKLEDNRLAGDTFPPIGR